MQLTLDSLEMDVTQPPTAASAAAAPDGVALTEGGDFIMTEAGDNVAV